MTPRRLAAILAADVVGFSRLIGADEAATLARLRALRSEVIEPLMTEHGGRVFKTTGDGLLAEFPSAVQALRCAIAIQERQRANPDALTLRIGLHTGDVVVEGDDLLGDGINIAARIEPLAEPGGIALSARIREDAVGKLDLAFEDLGTPALKNIAQPIQVFRIRPAAPERPALTLPDKPSLVVLPFQNMSGDPEQEYFADGMVEDITTALSRIGGLFVIARNSAFTFKGKPIDVKAVGRELGVRYVVEGSVRKAGGRVRITAQLIEAATATHLWADRFDGALDDIFDLQDRVTEAVAGVIEPALRTAEIARAVNKPTANLDTYDLYLRAFRHLDQYTPADLEAAIGLLRRAIALDPLFSLGKALFAYTTGMQCTLRLVTRDSAQMTEAIAAARAALADARDDPTTLRFAGLAMSYCAFEKAIARAALDRAIALNPNSGVVRAYSGWVNLHRGAWQAAHDELRLAIRLSPLDPDMRYILSGMSCALLELGRPEEALQFAHQSLAVGKGRDFGRMYIVYALLALDRPNEAKAEFAAIRARNPEMTVGRQLDDMAVWPAEVIARRVAIYRSLGLPE